MIKANNFYLFLSFVLFASSLFAEPKQELTKQPTVELTLDALELAYLEMFTLSPIQLDEFILSPDGKLLAYTIRQRPDDVDLNLRRMSNGTPATCVGTHIYIKDTNDNTIKIEVSGNCWRPTWSPNSLHLAFYSDANGRPQLWVYDVAENASYLASKIPVSASIVASDNPQWDKSNKMIYIPILHEEKISQISNSIVETTSSPIIEKPKVYCSEICTSDQKTNTIEDVLLKDLRSSIAAINIETNQQTLIVSSTATPKPAFFQLSPSGKWISYISPVLMDDITHVYFDLAITRTNGKGLVVPIASKLMTFHDISTMYQWHPTKDWLFYIQDKKLYVVEFDDNGPKPPKALNSEPLDLIVKPFLFTQDGLKVVVGGNPAEKNGVSQSLFIFSIQQSEVLEIDLQDKWEYAGIYRGTDKQIWQPIANSLILFLTEKATGQSAAVRFAFEGNKKTQEIILWRGLAQISAAGSQGNESSLYAIYQDVNTPPNIYRFNADFSKKQRITLLDPRLDKLEETIVELYQTRVPLHDGTLSTVQTAVLFPKKNHPDEKFPAIILFYPGGNVSLDGKEFKGGSNGLIALQLLLQKRYAIILPETPLGPEGKPGSPLQELVDVLMPQVYHIVDKGIVEVNRLAVMGLSYGGYGTAGIISKTNLFRAAIAASGLYDLGSLYGGFNDEIQDYEQLYAEHGQGRMGSHPWSDPFRYLQNSPYYLANNIRTPLLLIHGEKDLGEHVNESVKLFTALKRLHRPAELVVYPHEGHVPENWSRHNVIDVTKRILDHLDNHL